MAYYNNLKKYRNNIAAMESNGKKLTYAELEGFCEEIGDIIPERNLVFAFCENSIGSLCGYVAFLNNKIVPTLLDKHVEEGLAGRLLDIYKPDYVYVPISLKERYKKWSCVFEENDYSLLKTDYNYKHNLYEELGLLLSTSGSTGSPKLVRQSYKNIQANAESIAEYLKLDETERPITTLPMNYTYGLSIINSHLLVGATILMTNDTLMQREFWDYFKNEEATSFGGVPYTYEILKKLRFLRMELPHLKTMTQAGGKLSPELHKEFAEYAKEGGRRFVVMYGQTEATARMAYLPYEKSLEKYGSMGVAIPGGKLSLIDVNGNEIIEPEVVGELVYRGPNVTLGYATCANDLEKGDERKGVLETGDMAKRDEDGYYYIVGRKKRFLKIFGNRINLDEVERMIKTEFNHIECACAGVDDKLYIFATSSEKEIHNNIITFLSEKTGLNRSAFKLKEIESIPKNEAGKILYIKLEEYYE